MHPTESYTKKLAKEKCFSGDVAAHYVAQVVEALKYCHSCNVIHRDIKVNVKIVSLWLIKMSFAEFKLIIVRSMEIFSWVATDP